MLAISHTTRRFATLAAVVTAFGLAASAPARSDDTRPGCEHEGYAGHSMRGHHEPGFMGHDGGAMPPQLRGLKLDEAQRDRIFEVMHAQMPAHRAAMKAVRQSQQALRQIAAQAPFDAAKAQQAADAHGKAVATMALAHAETESRVRALLTAEQRAELDARRDARHGGKRGGHHDGRRGGPAAPQQ